MAGKPLRLLLVEDSAEDAQLLLRRLRAGGYDVTPTRVETALAMRTALESQPWDLVVADHALPDFSAPAALDILQHTGLDLPFIIVSAEISSTAAIAAMQAGAHDYIRKDDLTRLLPAIERELREAEARREHRRAEAALREREALYRSIIETTPDSIVLTDLNGAILLVNQPAVQLYGYASAEEVIGQNALEYIAPEDRPRAAKDIQRLVQTGRANRRAEYTMVCKDGRRFLAELNGSIVADAAGKPMAILSMGRDITERKRTEINLVYHTHRLEITKDNHE